MSQTTIIDEYKNKEVSILEKLNKKLNIIDKTQIFEPNFKGLNTSSINMDCSDTIDNGTENLVNIITDLQDSINALNIKYKNNVVQIEKVQKEFNLLNSNFQRLVYIVINYSKAMNEIEDTVDNFSLLIKNIRLECSKIKKMNDLKNVLSKNEKTDISEDCIENLKTMINSLNNLNITNKFDEIKRDILKINTGSSNNNRQIELIQKDINNIKKNQEDINIKKTNIYEPENFNNTSGNEKIIDLISGYHENIKNNIFKINKDMKNLYEKYNNIHNKINHMKINRINLKIIDLFIEDFGANVIINNKCTKIIGELQNRVCINKYYGIILINNMDPLSFVDIIGKIKIFNGKSSNIYKGIITNKNFQNNNPDGNIIYVLDQKDELPIDIEFDGFIKIEIKFFEE